jgi:phosphonate metabolism protein PhnN/1,5-bisphosphokinase (PRPP-forming)
MRRWSKVSERRMRMMDGTGTMVLVVGPSGAGKDTLLDGARTALAGDPRFTFVTRSITRPVGAGGEEHESLHERDFAAREIEGAFALSWRANGLGYGLPRASIAPALGRGDCVIANASRGAVEEARGVFASLRVVLVTASPDILARRLAGRGRETPEDIAARLVRAGAFDTTGCDVVIRNDGAPSVAITAFVNALRSFLTPTCPV